MNAVLMEDDDLELVDFHRPVRRDVLSRPPEWRLRPKHLSIAELRLAQLHLGCDRTAAYAKKVKGVIIGENPGRKTHPDLPLFPWPDTSSAGRLLGISGLTGGEYLGGLYRRNLCDTPGQWVRSAAERRARMVVTALFDLPKELRIVLCGRKVAKAFGLSDYQFWHPGVLESRQRYVVIPHPSGLNRVYNIRANRLATRAWMRWAAIGEEEPPCHVYQTLD